MSSGAAIPACASVRRRAAAPPERAPRSHAGARAGAPASCSRGERLDRVPDRPRQTPRSAAFQCSLEVPHQRGTEVAVGLLAGVDRHVLRGRGRAAPPDPQRAAVGGGVDQAGVGQRVDPRLDRGLHLLRLDHLVARAARRRRRRPSTRARRGSPGARAGRPRTRQPQVGGAGDDPLLAGRQVQPRAAHGDHVVHHVQQLAGAADREPLDGRHPQLLDARARRPATRPR